MNCPGNYFGARRWYWVYLSYALLIWIDGSAQMSFLPPQILVPKSSVAMAIGSVAPTLPDIVDFLAHVL